MMLKYDFFIATLQNQEGDSRYHFTWT